jgi:hypothetical protein
MLEQYIKHILIFITQYCRCEEIVVQWRHTEEASCLHSIRAFLLLYPRSSLMSPPLFVRLYFSFTQKSSYLHTLILFIPLRLHLARFYYVIYIRLLITCFAIALTCNYSFYIFIHFSIDKLR